MGDVRDAYPMRATSTRYCVVLVAGSMRTHDEDWAGLVLDADARAVTVKPLEVARADDDDDDDDDDDARTPCARLRVAHAYAMRRVERAAIMERLTFAPDGVGAVARRRSVEDAPPMLTRRFRIDVTRAERAMVGAESPERARKGGGGEIGAWEGVNRVYESDVYSLFEVRRGESSVEASPPEDATDDARDDARAATPSSSSRDEQGAGDSISPEGLGRARDARSTRETSSSASASRVEGVDAAFFAPTSVEWKGSISFLREQLAAQDGVQLILNRADVERMLEELTSDALD